MVCWQNKNISTILLDLVDIEQMTKSVDLPQIDLHIWQSMPDEAKTQSYIERLNFINFDQQ